MINISAIVVGRNESKKLENCLASLSFCEEILYADLNSDDNSIAVAEKYSCKIFRYKTFGPSCEHTQCILINEVKNNWVIMLDPDEVIDISLANQIKSELPNISNDSFIGDIHVPWQFYFGKKKLKGTVWGYNKVKGILVHKEKYEILPITHYGRRLKAGYKSFNIDKNDHNVLHHYWMDNINAFIKKHQKYLKDEGADRYNIGMRISVFQIFYQIFAQFYICFFKAKGYKDGILGLGLSLFWTYYCTIANCSLYRIIMKNKN